MKLGDARMEKYNKCLAKRQELYAKLLRLENKMRAAREAYDKAEAELKSAAEQLSFDAA